MAPSDTPRFDRRKKHPAEAQTKFERWVREQGGPAAVAKSIGVHTVTVSTWLARRATPSLVASEKILRLADGALTISDIVEGTRAR